MGHFGFSFVGALFLAALFIPNLIWGFQPRPRGYETDSENRVLQVLERVGQVLTVGAALLFDDTNLGPWSPWTWWLIAATVVMLAYEGAWIRYFASARTMIDFYRSLLGVPLPLATLPIAAFLLLGIYGRLLPLVLATIVLGIGHIGIHLQHYRTLPRQPSGPDAPRADGREKPGF